MICFDVYLNGEKLCRAGMEELSVISGMTVYVRPKPDDDGTIPPLYTSLGGLSRTDDGVSVHSNWITEQPLTIGDEVTFKIVESDTADAPESQTATDPAWDEQQQRRYYEMLKAKYENSPE